MSSRSIGRGTFDSGVSDSLASISSTVIPSSRVTLSTRHGHGEAAVTASSSSSDDEPRAVNGTNYENVGMIPTLQNDTLHSEQTVSSITGGFEEPIKLTQSTYSFLFTEPVHSWPFAFAVGILLITWACLLLALIDNIYMGYTPPNPLSVPAGVTDVVKAAQYLALIIGSIMEEEIPDALYMLRMISRTTLHKVDSRFKYRRFVVCSMLRIVMGYLYIVNMFVVVIQATRVIDIFFNVLALEFLQRVDDIAFRLSKMDVFGKHLKRASTRKYFRTEFEKLPFHRRKKRTVFVKAIYGVNFCLLMWGLSTITRKQMSGTFQCASITVTLPDYIWENVLHLSSTGVEVVYPCDLDYSYFNGVYVKNGTYSGRPRYTEQNKFNDEPYAKTIGATIQYCPEEQAWVFMHERIRKEQHRQNVSCPWLMKSPETNSYDLLDVLGDWSIWTGVIESGVHFHADCNECESVSDCNFHGKCMGGVCHCRTRADADDYILFTGPLCQYPVPCRKLRGNSGDEWNALVLLDNHTLWKTYGRGVYHWELGGFYENRTETSIPILMYSGSRWIEFFFTNSKNYSRDVLIEDSREIHPFWMQICKEYTYSISSPTTRSDPIGVDFFEIGKRGEKYGPMGELIPMQDPPGSGYFDCIVEPMSSIL